MMHKTTIEFYNKNAKAYAETTLALDIKHVIVRFSNWAKENGDVLDLGCGAGRDLQTFKDLGFNVTGVDLSVELLQFAQKIPDVTVLHQDILTLSLEKQFDAIWCCTSLVHFTKSELISAIGRIKTHLKDDGVAFISLKEGSGPYIDSNDRFMNSFKREEVERRIQANGMEVIEFFSEEHAIKSRGERIINFIIKKKL